MATNLNPAMREDFDIRVDEEQYLKLAELLDLLISAGYFRAKIQGLSSFDKIVGGMVYCISLCAQSVNVDLLYSENSTIGKKIALTERIVEVLPKLNCPYSLEPHQIQGLDCIHIFPIIKWLVKEVVEVKNKRGDEQHNFAVYQFVQGNWKIEGDKDSGVRPVVKSKKVYKRMIRMKPIKADTGLNEKPTNASSDNNVEHTSDFHQENNDPLVVCKDGDFTTTEVVPENEIFKNKLNSASTSAEFIDTLKNKLSTLENEEKLLTNEVDVVAQRYNELKLEAEFIQSQIDVFNEAVHSTNPSELETIKSLLIERNEIKENESFFKRECRKQIEELDNQIEKSKVRGNTNFLNDVKDEKKDLRNRLNILTNELGKWNREIYKLEREVEKCPSQIELNQYQRRFVELYNQMSNKHRETKRYYTLYNTLLDIRNFIKREIDLLNSIDDSKNLTLKDSVKDSFVENLRNICRNVEKSLDKILCGKNSLQDQRDALANNLQLLVDKQRLYMKTVAEFQAECQKNEQFRAILEKKSES